MIDRKKPTALQVSAQKGKDLLPTKPSRRKWENISAAKESYSVLESIYTVPGINKLFLQSTETQRSMAK